MTFPNSHQIWLGGNQNQTSLAQSFMDKGFEKLKEYIEKWEGPVATARHNLRLFADKETYEAMDGLAKLQNKSAHQLAMD
ncbi:hypothetical protein RIF29_15658 [Crotalaria pallida]|uniref:Uncharacterized protein n=1 Tax=Crotalaria pallida TaxID=3830 RepID=A0AAN9FDV8_CROPI